MANRYVPPSAVDLEQRVRAFRRCGGEGSGRHFALLSGKGAEQLSQAAPARCGDTLQNPVEASSAHDRREPTGGRAVPSGTLALTRRRSRLFVTRTAGGHWRGVARCVETVTIARSSCPSGARNAFVWRRQASRHIAVAADVWYGVWRLRVAVLDPIPPPFPTVRSVEGTGHPRRAAYPVW